MRKHLWLRWGASAMIALALTAGCAKEQPTAGGTGRTAPATPVTPAAAPAGEGTGAGTGMEGAEKFTYTCPMHPEVEQDGPGRCPECKMFLTAQVAEGATVEYYCPMDEGQEAADPGKCSACGMFLVAQTKAAPGEEGETGTPAEPETEG